MAQDQQPQAAKSQQVLDIFKDPTVEFALVEKLGQGSYGSVWKATHRKSGGAFAVKVLKMDQDLAEVRREIDFMKQLKHENVVCYYGSYFNALNELWIVMEYCAAGSCADIIKVCKKPFSEEQIISVCRDVLQGLHYLHSRRKLHRDIKAGNILLNAKGQGKLADFGVSGQLTDTMSRMNTVIGTPFWMAPEVITEVGYTEKIDIWSLGITAIELAQGAPPLSQVHPMKVIFLIPSLPSPTLDHPEAWSQDFNSFLTRCLQKEPQDRADTTQLLQDKFIQKHSGSSCLIPLIKEQEEVILREGREHALGLDQIQQDAQPATQQQNNATSTNTKMSTGSESASGSFSSATGSDYSVSSEGSGDDEAAKSTRPKHKKKKSLEAMLGLPDVSDEENSSGTMRTTNTAKTNTNSILPDSQLLQKEIAFMQDIITRKEAEWSKLETQIQQVNKELSSCIPPSSDEGAAGHIKELTEWLEAQASQTKELRDQLSSLKSQSMTTKLQGQLAGCECVRDFNVTDLCEEAQQAQVGVDDFPVWIAGKFVHFRKQWDSSVHK